MPQLAQRVRQFSTTIFAEINALAAQYDAVNLGQGKPDFDTPADVVGAAIDAFHSGKYSQYAPGYGAPALTAAIAAHAERFYGLKPNPNGGIIVTSGATQAIFAAILGTLDPGDEVIVLEPFFDIYVPSILMAGGVPVYVALQPPDWSLPLDALRAAFNEKTRAIIINSPNNPTGRVFSHEELSAIAALCVEYDVICIADEVYEHLTFDEHTHTPIATFAGMWERTLSVSSVAKSFSATGWKIGWVYGDPSLITGVWRAHQLITYAVNHPSQVGVAYALNMPDEYHQALRAEYNRKRALLMQGLDAAKLRYSVPQGAFYIMADFSDVFEGDDLAFARHLITEIGVAAIPPSSFYSDGHRSIAQHTIRFAFCKTDALLEQACERLVRLAR